MDGLSAPQSWILVSLYIAAGIGLIIIEGYINSNRSEKTLVSVDWTYLAKAKYTN